MKEIILKNGMIVKVDDEDYQRLSEYSWSVLRVGILFYAQRWGGKRVVLMHRQILNITDSNIFIDHKNHNGLDNQKHNLRSCTRSQNMQNRRAHGVSKYLGVSWDKNRSKWVAQINHDKVRKIGRFTTEEEAAKAYDKIAKVVYGEFANLNFKDNG